MGWCPGPFRAAPGWVPAWGSGDVGRGGHHLLLRHVLKLQLHDPHRYHQSRHGGSVDHWDRVGASVAKPEREDRAWRRGRPPPACEVAWRDECAKKDNASTRTVQYRYAYGTYLRRERLARFLVCMLRHVARLPHRELGSGPLLSPPPIWAGMRRAQIAWTRALVRARG